MAYCSINDMRMLLPDTMLVNLSNDTAGAVIVHDVNIAESIDQADREIDSYLNIAGYTVPMTPIPPLVTNLSAKMAIWNLHLRKYFDSTIWRNTYLDCLRILERIAEGKLTLGQETTGETQTGANAGNHVVSSRTQKFSQTTWDEY